MAKVEPKVAYALDAGQSHISLDMPRTPPRLSRALFWAPSGRYSGMQTDLEKEIAANVRAKVDLSSAGTFEAELGVLLKHIYQRLQIGLDEAWLSKYGYDAPQAPKKDGKSDEEYAKDLRKAWESAFSLIGLWQEPEEMWARAFAEMYVYMPYGGPAMATFTNHSDAQIYKHWPAVYPVVAACQHLSTYAVLTRGFEPSTVGSGLEAGPNGAVPIFGAEVKPPARPGWTTAEVSEYEANDLRPGDVLSGDDGANKGPLGDQRLFGHSASTLRRWPLGAKAAAVNANAGYKLQMIDTGVLAGVGDVSTQDYDWLEAVNGFGAAAKGRTGFGRLPEPTNLAAAVAGMRKALPMGFTRLALVSAGSGAVRYLSAMLPMWSGEHRFAFSRYLWSLRDLPAKNVDAYWILYAPHGQTLFDELVKEAAGPNRTCEQMVDDATKARAALVAHKGDPPSFTRVGACASVNGKPRVLRVVNRGKDNVKWKEVDAGGDIDQQPAAGSASNELTELTGEDPMKAALPLKLEVGPNARPGGWQFLDSIKRLSQEVLVPPDRKPSEVDSRSMTENKNDYFKG